MASLGAALQHWEDFIACLQCPLCNEALKSAHTFGTCGHTFCYDCVIGRLEGPGISKSECPACKQPAWKNDLRPNHPFNNVQAHAQLLAQQVVHLQRGAEPQQEPTSASPAVGRSLLPSASLEVAREGSEAGGAGGDGGRQATTQQAAEIAGYVDPLDGATRDSSIRDVAAMGPQSSSPPQLDFGAADFGPAWRAAELAKPPPDAHEMQRLQQQIALLEAAVQLCDTLPCRPDVCCEVAAGPAPDAQDAQPASGGPSQRRLSEFPTLSQHPSKNSQPDKPAQPPSPDVGSILPDSCPDCVPPTEEIPFLEDMQLDEGMQDGDVLRSEGEQAQQAAAPAGRGSSRKAERSEDTPSLPASKRMKGTSGGASLGEQRLKEDGVTAGATACAAAAEDAAADAATDAAAPPAWRTRRATLPATSKPSAMVRRLERAEAVADRLLHPHDAAKAGTLSCPLKGKVGVGCRVVVEWQEGPYLGMVTAVDRAKGRHQIFYTDGDQQWHDLDEERWRLATSQDGDEPSQRGSETDRTAESQQQQQQQQPKEATPEVYADAYVFPASPAKPDPKQEKPRGQLLAKQHAGAAATEQHHKDLLLASSKAQQGAASPQEGSLPLPPSANLGTQDAASLLFSMRCTDAAPRVVLASHLARSAAAPAGPRNQPPHEGEQVQQPCDRLPARSPPRPRASSGHRASQGRPASQHQRQSQSGSIKDFMLRAQSAVAAASLPEAPLHLVLSGATVDLQQRVLQLQALDPGVRLDEEISEHTTHVLVETDDHGVATRRSRQYLEGVARGCWVVSLAWLDACLAAGKRAPERRYEATGVTICKEPTGLELCGTEGAPERSRRRVARGEAGLFAGHRFFVGNFLKSKQKLRELMRRVLVAAGGTAVRALGGGGDGEGVIVLTDDPAVAQGLRARGWGGQLVAPPWVLDSVTCGRLLPLAHYRIA